MSRRILIVLTSVLAVGAMAISSSAASAAQTIYEDEAKTKVVPVGTNWSAAATGATLTSGTLVITCPTSSVGGTITANSGAPTSSIQSAVFGGKCHDNHSPTNRFVRVKTNTTTPWTLTWIAANKFEVTGIEATIEIESGPTCTVKNKTGTKFELTWANKVTDSTLTATNAKVALSGGACGLTEGSESVTYSVNGAPDEANNLWLF